MRGRGPGVLARGLAVAFMLASLPVAGAAQDLSGVTQSQVLVVNSDQLFSDSAYGRRIEADIAAESMALETENRRIESELEAEEQALTDSRATMTPEAFRALAEAFDTKVTRIRSEQGAKARALQIRSDQARRQFLGVVGSILESLMQEAGAAVILEQRSVFFSARAVDVTSAAVARLDAAIGDGRDLPPPEPAQE